LFNRLTGANVFAKDMLFATLDPTMRKITLPTGDEIIMSDTVGFISDLPTELVAAFRATLEEVLDADLIVHVRDISHPQTEEQSKDVMTILQSLGVAEEAPLIEVWNKVDLLEGDARDAVLTQAARTDDLYAVSAITGEGMDRLLAAIPDKLKDPRSEEKLSLTFAEGRKRAWLFEAGIVTEESQIETGYDLTVFWTSLQKERFVRL
jgi:GTP-binding protein HflX